MRKNRASVPSPVAFSLARYGSALSVGAALALATAHSAKAATSTWIGDAAPTPGDGELWTNPLNWSGDLLPAAGDDAVFGDLGATLGTIHLGGNQTVNSLSFTRSFTLGAYGYGSALTNTGGAITVNAGALATINSVLSGSNGLSLSGGGTLYLTNPFNSFTGNMTIDGAGTQLLVRSLGQSNPIGRVDLLPLGQFSSPRNITLQGGGELKVIGGGYNPDGAKNIVLGTGGGAINVSSGYQQVTMDDGSQLSGAGVLTKNGNGRLFISGQDYNLTGGVVVNSGFHDIGRLQGGSTTAATRFSAYAGLSSPTASTTTSVTVNGGMFILNNGTVGVADQKQFTVNGGILAVQAADNEFGVRTNVGTDFSTLTIGSSGATILARDAFNPQQQRATKINALLEGSGQVDLIGSTQNTFNTMTEGTFAGPRVVFQRGDLAHTYTGTIVVHSNTSLESNPRFGAAANIGKTFGSATIELRGFNSGLDLRDNGSGNDGDLSTGASNYTTNDVRITGTDVGGIQRISAIQCSANTGNVFHLDDLQIGNHRLVASGNNNYGLRFNTLTLPAASQANPVIEVVPIDAASATFKGLEISGALNEPVANDGITKIGGGTLSFGNAVALTNYNVGFGTVRLFGASGTLNAGAMSGTGAIVVNGSVNSRFANAAQTTAGLLHLDNNSGNTGGSIGAATNANRLSDTVAISMLSNSTLRLTSQNNVAVTETTGNLTISGQATFDVVKTGTPVGAPVVLNLGTAAPVLTANSAMNLTGTSLGATGVNSTRIVIPGQATTSFMGANVTSGNEWARYDSTADGTGVAIGAVQFVAANYTINTTESTWAPGQHLKLNSATGTALTAARNIDTLNLQFSAATNQSVATAGNLLTVEQGGILSATNTAGITGNANGGLTAGNSASPASLVFNNNAQLDVNAIIRDNAAGGAVTLVKNGTGTLRLTHQSLAVGGQPGGTNFGAGHANTFTGGIVINNGTLETHRASFIANRPITLNGGTLSLNEPTSGTNNNTNQVINFGNNITVNGNASIVWDNNGEVADGSAGNNNLFALGTLTVNGGHIVGIGGFNGVDASVAGASFTGTPTINLGINRGPEGFVVNGVQSGSGFNIEAFGDTAGFYQLGGGASDTAANTYSGLITISRTTGSTAPILRLNKANGTAAVTGDLVINGGTVAWGPGALYDRVDINNNAWNGNGVAGGAFSGQNQIPDNATITLLSGDLGQNNQLQVEKFGSLIQKNGNFATGFGVLEMDNWTMSGGSVTYSGGATVKVGTANFQSGAQEITIGGNLMGSASTLEVGAGGLTLAGQSLFLGNNSYTIAGGGGVLKLGGTLTVNFDPMNASTSSAQKGIFTGGNGRELANNNYIDLAGGTRTINIDQNVWYTVNVGIVNGGIDKQGGGTLAIQNWNPNTFDGSVTVGAGTLLARSATALGSTVGGTTVSDGGTLKLDGGWNVAENITLTGPGALIPNGNGTRELGALVSETGTNTLTGTVTLNGDSIIATAYAQQSGHGNAVSSSSLDNWGPLVGSKLTIASAGGIVGSGNLTITASGDVTVTNGVNTTSGSLIKNGNGTLILGAGTYAGATTVEAGTLRAVSNSSLGATTSGTTVLGGATLQLAGGLNISEGLQLNGNGVGEISGALESVGNNTFSGIATLAADATIRSTSGTLAITNATGITGGNVNVTFAGEGNTLLNGGIDLGNGSLVKNGGGVLTLANANSFSGQTKVNGGTLVLDYSANNTASSRIDAASSLALGSGSVVLNGNSGAASTQLVNGLFLSGGSGKISAVSNGAQTATFGLGAITRNAGGTVDFTLPASGSITTSSTPVNGVLGGYATVGGSDWATTSGANIVAFSAYAPLVNATGTDTNNSIVTATRGPQTAAVTTNSLKITGGSGLSTGANGLTLSSGGLLYTGTGNFGLSGGATGVIGGATVNDELFVHAKSGNLLISNPLIGNGTGQLTKAGAGTLTLLGTSTFTGAVNINEGTLAIVGPGGTNDATGLGGHVVADGGKAININGGTFSVKTGDYDPGVDTKKFVIGPAGGTLHVGNGQLILNDADANYAALSGSGQLVKTGGGRLTVGSASTGFTGFTGDTVIQEGTLVMGHGFGLGGRSQQTITFKPGTNFINSAHNVQAPTNSFVFEGNNEISGGGTAGDRMILGAVTMSGNNRLLLVQRDSVATAYSMGFSGPVNFSGTLDVVGVNVNGRLDLASGANTFAAGSVINLGSNTALEARTPGSLGAVDGALTVNLNGTNSRLLLRHHTNGDYHANVNVNADAQLNVNQLANYTVGAQQLLSVNNLTTNGERRLEVGGLASYWVQVKGSATANGNLFLTTTSNLRLDNGMSVTGDLEKRGAGIMATYAPVSVSGATRITGGTLDLRGSTGSLATTGIDINGGGQLFINNVDASNSTRVTAPIRLNSGTLRVAGTTTGLGAITAGIGSSGIQYQMDTQTTAVPLSLTGFTRTGIGAHVNFATDYGTLGAPTQTFVNPRILIPGQTDLFGTGAVGSVDIIPWATNGNEFVSYRTTQDSGVDLGVTQIGNTFMRSDAGDGTGAGQLRSTTAPNEIMRFSGNTTTTLAGNATFRALKMDGAGTRTLDVGANTLTIDRGAIIFVANDQRIGGNGTLTAGTTASATDLMFNVNGGQAFVNTVIANNAAGGTVSLVKNGAGTLILENANASTYTGGTYVNAGVLRVDAPSRLGLSTNPVFLQGGRLELNALAAGPESNVMFGQNITVNYSAALGLDNGVGGTVLDNNFILGSLTVNNGATFQMSGFDGTDAEFTQATLNGNPTIDLANGRGSTAADISTFTIKDALNASNGFTVTATGNNANNPNRGILVLGGGATDTVANTTGTVTMQTAGNQAPQIDLNKAPGTNAISGNIVLDGGILRNLANNQIADTANVSITGNASATNPFTWQLNGQTETVANIEMNGGGLSTGASGQLTVTGNMTLNATSQADGLQINSKAALGANSLVNVQGTLFVNDTGRVVLGADGATLSVSSLNMTGGVINQNSGSGNNNVVLNGNVTATSTTVPALLGNSNDSDTFLDLGATRTFTVNDGPNPLDLVVSTVVRNGTGTGGIVKEGDGVMVLQGGGTANSYTGGTTVNAGELQLSKSVGVNAIPAGTLTIGDGIGGAKADRVVLRNSNQIADASKVVIGSSGVLDLAFANTSETVSSLEGSGSVDLGPGSSLVINGSLNTVFSGPIEGGGSLTVGGSGSLELSGSSDIAGGTTVTSTGRLLVNGALAGAVQIDSNAILGGAGTLNGPINVNGTLVPGASVGTLTANSTVAFNAGSSLSIELTGTGSDQLTVGSTGSINITGGNVTLTLGFEPAFGQQFTIINNLSTSPIGGAFANVADGGIISATFNSVQYDFVADYQGGSGNDLVLTVPEPTSMTALLAGLGICAGLRRFRRRSASV